MIHLYTLGYRQEDLVSFKCRLNNPSKIAEMQELEHWKTRFDIAGAATEGFFSKQWLARTLFGLSDEEFIRNRREMFYDKRFEAALETIGEVEQAELTAGINAGTDELDVQPDAGLGGTGTVGTEPELGAAAATDPPAATPDTAAAADPAAAAPAEGDLLATPPGKREDKKGRTTTAKSHGW